MSFPVSESDFRPSEGGLLYVPPGEGLIKWVSGDIYVIKAAKGDTGGSLSFIEAVIPPGSGPIAHAHAAEDEAFFLLDGELEFLDGDRTGRSRSGTSSYAHSFYQPTRIIGC